MVLLFRGPRLSLLVSHLTVLLILVYVTIGFKINMTTLISILIMVPLHHLALDPMVM